MDELRFPCTIFTTQKKMDDFNARDMRCGDLTAFQLKEHFKLSDVSSRVNPYTMVKLNEDKQTWSLMPLPGGLVKKINKQDCAKILFDEFRHLSKAFSFAGPYKTLIAKMISHMQVNNGCSFRDNLLNIALKEQILRDESKNSTRVLLIKSLSKNIDWKNKICRASAKEILRETILEGMLPKFNRMQDHINGMGITVHDTWATQITIKSLTIDKNTYRAVVHYKVQDHFGLDDQDISQFKFRQLRFFRIWFVLQRYCEFGFKPFMTNMDATIEINGDRLED